MDSNIWKIKSWILQIHPGLSDINIDLDLIEQRLIDSLRFVDLIFLIEELAGRPIEISKIHIDQIRTLNTIKQTFFSETNEA